MLSGIWKILSDIFRPNLFDYGCGAKVAKAGIARVIAPGILARTGRNRIFLLGRILTAGRGKNIVIDKREQPRVYSGYAFDFQIIFVNLPYAFGCGCALKRH